MPKPSTKHPLVISAVPIDTHCTGSRWTIQDEDRLARLIAIVALGQARYAASLLTELRPAEPRSIHEDSIRAAKKRLRVQKKKHKGVRRAYPRYQRDGLIFEVISWIAAHQSNSQALLKIPHISSTSQGLDGLMIELTNDKSKIIKTTIFEDKCTINPRNTFISQVIPTFVDHHKNNRCNELLSAADTLLSTAGIDPGVAVDLAAAVMDPWQRHYRAAFALSQEYDSQQARQRLFKDYDTLAGISADQRVGAGLIVTGNLRRWFDGLASRAIKYLDELR